MTSFNLNYFFTLNAATVEIGASTHVFGGSGWGVTYIKSITHILTINI